MKIIAISDIHGYLPQLPKCDVVTISGDILPLHIQDKYEDALCWLAGPFQDWALKLDCDKIIFINYQIFYCEREPVSTTNALRQSSKAPRQHPNLPPRYLWARSRS
jgi:hypothetical protein